MNAAMRAAILAAHKAATRKLREGPSYATPAPMGHEVRNELLRAGNVEDPGREAVFDLCREAGLPLADAPAEADEITRKLKARSR